LKSQKMNNNTERNRKRIARITTEINEPENRKEI
jgi:ribosomal protein L29